MMFKGCKQVFWTTSGRDLTIASNEKIIGRESDRWQGPIFYQRFFHNEPHPNDFLRFVPTI